MPADRSGPQHHHPGRLHAGAAAHQHAAAAMGSFQQVGPHLGCQPPGDFAHRRQEGQAAVVELHGFVGHRRGARLEQGPAHLGIGGEMQVGEQHLVLAQVGKFLGLGLLHLHHQAGGPGLLGADQVGPGGREGAVADPGSRTGLALDAHLEPMADQFAHAIGGEGDPLLIPFDLGRYADAGDRGA